MQCLIPTRRYGASLSPLQTLLKNATVLAISGRDTATTGRIRITLDSTTLPSSGTVYYFIVSAGDVAIWKAVNGTISQTPVVQTDSSRCGIYERTGTHQLIYSTNGTYRTGTTSTPTYSTTYGATMVAISFLGGNVDAILTSGTTAKIAGASSSTQVASPSTSNTTYKTTLAAYNDGIAFYTAARKLLLAANNPATVSGNTITLPAAYAYSFTGFDS